MRDLIVLVTLHLMKVTFFSTILVSLPHCPLPRFPMTPHQVFQKLQYTCSTLLTSLPRGDTLIPTK